MFDASSGEAVFRYAYDTVLRKNDPDVWDSGGYVTWECWQYAATNVCELLSDDEVTDLMAYVIECNPDNAHTVFCDGFTYLLGQMMLSEYELGE